MSRTLPGQTVYTKMCAFLRFSSRTQCFNPALLYPQHIVGTKSKELLNDLNQIGSSFFCVGLGRKDSTEEREEGRF